MDKWKAIAQSFRSMGRKDHFLYWGYPIILSFILMVIYFQGPDWMQELAAPTYNREFGLVENTQNIILLITIYRAFQLLTLPYSGWLNFAYLLIFCTAVFVFLEEIDYGHHYINYINDASEEQRSINHNIHNISNVNNQLRLFFYILIGIFIIVLPYFSSSRLPSFVNHFVSDIRLQLTVVAFLVISKMAGIFYDNSYFTNQVLNGNISEFEELPLYYLFMIYVNQLYPGKFSSSRYLHETQLRFHHKVHGHEMSK